MDKTIRVLYVDDIAFSRLMVERALTSEGYEVICSSNANEALAELQAHDVDVVVTDLSMPEMNGVQLLEESKNIKKLTDTGYVKPPPFILLTAIHDKDALLDAQRAGFVQILLKPFDIVRMKEAISLAMKSKT